MVHIKRIELTHFKSFGGSTKIPILPGFTVVSGPNGSGKSNILDALLFCLGLANSKGMRADRLPDLVNHKQNTNGRAAETMVSVTFDLEDWDGFDEMQALAEERHAQVAQVEAELGNSNEINPGLAPEVVTSNVAVATLEPVEESTPQIELTGLKEWTVSRRLRVSKKGSYSSTFYSNGEVCTSREIHEQLEKLRIYPEGYNVVLQGDVTRIISMNSRERREIIDELAGVAAFDRKIEQTRKTLEKVKEREEHCHIIEQELMAARDRLAADRVKAEKYRKLKQKVQEKKQQEIVLFWRSLVQQKSELEQAITKGAAEITRLSDRLNKLAQTIQTKTVVLNELNTKVRALGEDEQLAVASELATQKAQRDRALEKQQELASSLESQKALLAQTQVNLQQYQTQLTDLGNIKLKLEQETIPQLTQEFKQAENLLKERREIANAIAAASEAWVQEQAQLTRDISALQNSLNPQRTEQATFTERQAQIATKITEEQSQLEQVSASITEKTTREQVLNQEFAQAQQQVQQLAVQLSEAESDRTIQRETLQRLLVEQRNKQRELDKLEATKQAQQEAQGTFASKAILNANLAGVHGLVVQLGKVEPQYHLALETAAGGRLGYIVVEDDRVGAQGIELLKQKRAGRATFLPLNKIKAPQKDRNMATMRFGRGYIDFAVNLVTCEPQYQRIFTYVFGNTLVFDTLNNARSMLGKYRIVTLEGDILEMSGAMSGGSKSSRSSLRFGKVGGSESRAVVELRERLQEISSILSSHDNRVAKLSQTIKQLGENLTEAKQLHREKQLRLEQLQKEIQQLQQQQTRLQQQLAQHQQNQHQIQERSQDISTNLPEQEAKLQELQAKLNQLEESHDQSEWQQVQQAIRTQEQNLQDKQNTLIAAQDRFKDAVSQIQRLEEKSTEATNKIQELETTQTNSSEQQVATKQQLSQLAEQIATLETKLQELNQKLGETKVERDRAESELKELQNQQQQKTWNKEKIEATQTERQEQLIALNAQIVEREQELTDSQQAHLATAEESDVVPKDRETLWQELYQELFATENSSEQIQITHALLVEKLEQLQRQIRNGEKRLEAMEPVNMLALEEYEKTEARLQELTEKLNTIEAERTELLLRVEKFTTLRLRAFKEAYDAVDVNFQKIFAELSEGDGHLQLEDPEDPFNGGLMLVAHPKGKPVQRLSSMSGGEKSLTALSFIFSLQKYRPSPFYAFDEVDMFLDGANVEKLSRMVKKQAQEAQFIVVSLRRPMIEASERTIGVTQARGAHTQVLGIKL